MKRSLPSSWVPLAVLGATMMPCLMAHVAEAQVTTEPVSIISKVSGKCVSVQGDSTWNSIAAVQSTCNGTAARSWTLRPHGDAYQVVASHTQSCLNVAWGATHSGAGLEQYSCTGAQSQDWTLEQAGTFYRLKGKQSRKCLAVENGSENSGTRLIQEDCSAHDKQLWSFSDGFVSATQPARLVLESSKSCVQVAGTSAGAPATQRACTADGGPTQGFRLKRFGDGYQVVAQGSGQCLGVGYGATNEGAAVVQYPCNGARDQTWDISPQGTGFRLFNYNSGRCLAAQAGAASEGAPFVIRDCDGAGRPTFRVSVEQQLGAWGRVIPLPVIPVAAASLINGKVLLWAAADTQSWFVADLNQTQTALFDVAAETSSPLMTITDTKQDMICPGTAMLPDGRVMVNGGMGGRESSIYNPLGGVGGVGVWSKGALMNTGRGYNADTVLEDGSVFTIGGSWGGFPLEPKNGELWRASPNTPDPSTNDPTGLQGKWTATPGLSAGLLYEGARQDPADTRFLNSSYRSDNQAWLFGNGDGWVFHAGPGPMMHWFDTTGRRPVRSLARGDGMSQNGNAAMYDTRRILKLGGSEFYEENSLARKSAYRIELTADSATVTPTGSLNFGRTFANSVVLPDGRVFVVGGMTQAVTFSDKNAVLATEMWKASSNAFSVTATTSVPRNYHSVALLLPDGRVLSGGGGLCMFIDRECGANHPDLQLYSPDYLFQPNGELAVRPRITPMTAEARKTAPGRTMAIETDGEISEFALVRMSSVTHSVNNDQRRITLTPTGGSGNRYTVAIPSDAGVVIPGYYMLFALNRSNVPSVAEVVQIQGPG